jgi:hypothetical protein
MLVGVAPVDFYLIIQQYLLHLEDFLLILLLDLIQLLLVQGAAAEITPGELAQEEEILIFHQ